MIPLAQAAEGGEISLRLDLSTVDILILLIYKAAGVNLSLWTGIAILTEVTEEDIPEQRRRGAH